MLDTNIFNRTSSGGKEISEKRLLKINYPGSGNNSQFTYDGYGRTVAILETVASTVTSTKDFVWADGVMREARNSSGALLNQYFELGQTIGGSDYFYTKEGYAGSVREMTDSSGAMAAQYTFDFFGRATKIQGASSSDFQFDGYYFHIPSGLCLTVNRPYNPSIGRWINRDPIGERGGNNLYAYVNNSPIFNSDRLGLYNDAGFTNCNGYSCGTSGASGPDKGQTPADFFQKQGFSCNPIDTAADCKCAPGDQKIIVFVGSPPGEKNPPGFSDPFPQDRNDPFLNHDVHSIAWNNPKVPGQWSQQPGLVPDWALDPKPVTDANNPLPDSSLKYGSMTCCCKPCKGK